MKRRWILTPDEVLFPISRDPPEGGTKRTKLPKPSVPWRFQFLGIPPKGEQEAWVRIGKPSEVSNF